MKNLFLVLSVLIAGGCAVPMPIPHEKVTAYRTRGRVVDSVSGAPVGGARIAYEGRPDLVFQAGADGTFDIPAQDDLVLASLVGPGPVIDFPKASNFPRAVIISQAGYRPARIELMPYYMQRLKERGGPRFIVELRDIKLTAERAAESR